MNKHLPELTNSFLIDALKAHPAFPRVVGSLPLVARLQKLPADAVSTGEDDDAVSAMLDKLDDRHYGKAA